jgi:hypothetical protein
LKVLGAWACAPSAIPIASSEATMVLLVRLVLAAMIGLHR